MKTQKIMRAAAISLLSSSFLLGSLHPALADDCRPMIQKNIDFSKLFVLATISMHAPQLADDSVAGRVEYGSGFLYQKNQSLLTGVISGRVNTSTWQPVPPSGLICSGPNEFSPRSCLQPNIQPFAPLPQLTYEIGVTNTGVVSVRTLINGKNFLGRAPVVFQGTCSGSLITGAVNGKAYSITLKHGGFAGIH